MNPIALAIASDASYVARAFSGDVAHLTDLLKKAIRHRGFALVDILQPCVSFNRTNTYEWYKERVYKLEDEKGYDPRDRMAAFARAQEWGDRMPIGVIFTAPRPVYEDRLPALKRVPLVKQELDPLAFEGLLDEFV